MSSLIGRLTAVPRSGLALALGTAVVAITTYVYLLISGQVLGDRGYAPFGALWMIVYLVAPAIFFPVEQELTRAIAVRRHHGEQFGPLVKKAVMVVLAMVLISVGLAFVASGVLSSRMFNHQALLFASLPVALGSFALNYLARGVLAGSGCLGAYGLLMSAEGVLRLLAGVGLLLSAVDMAGPFGLVFAVAPAVALLVVLPTLRQVVQPGPQAKWRDISVGIADLVMAGFASQALINLAPLVVKYAAEDHEEAVAGAFGKAVIITRIPLFLYGAVQALVLPKLSALAVSNDFRAYRRLLLRLLLAVFAFGLVGVAVIVGASPLLFAMFGSEGGLSRVDMALLGVGNALFLLAMTAAQALISVDGQRLTVWGWLSGLAVFAVALLFPGDIVVRVELALLVGAAAATATLLMLLSHRLHGLQRSGFTKNEHLASEPALLPPQ